MHSPSYLMFERQIKEHEAEIAALQETIDNNPEIDPLSRKPLDDLQNLHRNIIDLLVESMQHIT